MHKLFHALFGGIVSEIGLDLLLAALLFLFVIIWYR